MAERRYDLIAVGGGFSGLVAAGRAAELGLKAVVLEARGEAHYPCSSRYSTGVFGVMGLSLMNPPERLCDAILDETDFYAKPALARAIAQNARRAHDWLVREGARFEAPPFAPPGTLERSAHVIAPARRFGFGLDWPGRGADLLMQRLEENFLARGGEVRRGMAAERILVEDGAAIGIEAAGPDGTERCLAAAVVIADGGFAANPALLRRWITPHPDRVLARVGPGAQGDGILMAEAAGAATGGFGAFYGHVHHREAMTNAALWPYPHFDALAEAAVVVGPDGKRFADERLGGVALANAIARLPDPLSAVIVFDEAMWCGAPGKAGPVGINPALLAAGGWLMSAPDLTALAARAELPADALAATVAAHNRAAEWPIARPPFHAAPLCAGVTGTMGGIEIDGDARALRADGTPFPGLYAVGTPVAHLEGGPRAGYVGGLAKAFVLGLLAAEHAVAQQRAAAISR